MGGERFETSQPEGYLFGENNDLNFLGSKPVSVSESSNFYLKVANILLIFCFIIEYLK
jgi:hypothetical protein